MAIWRLFLVVLAIYWLAAVVNIFWIPFLSLAVLLAAYVVLLITPIIWLVSLGN